jgi:hypothetical protein
MASDSRKDDAKRKTCFYTPPKGRRFMCRELEVKQLQPNNRWFYEQKFIYKLSSGKM